MRQYDQSHKMYDCDMKMQITDCDAKPKLKSTTETHRLEIIRNIWLTYKQSKLIRKTSKILELKIDE